MNVSDGLLPEQVRRNFWSLWERKEGGEREAEGGTGKVMIVYTVVVCSPNLSTLLTTLLPSLSYLVWNRISSVLSRKVTWHFPSSTPSTPTFTTTTSSPYTHTQYTWTMMFSLREWEINSWQKKFWDPAGIWTQDFLNTSEMLLPLSHLDPSGRGVKRQAT